MTHRGPFGGSGLLLGFLAVTTFAVGGCYQEYGYRVYDPGYHDYHVYDRNEGVYYNTWVTENHRPHTDFRKLSKEDQQNYWNGRHDHPDHH